jgi:hypothetical protein
MNIFYLDNDPRVCAEMHLDKHVVKMILEYAQLLSTAHRVLDGTINVGLSKTGRKQTRYVLPNDLEYTLYSATHINHPSAQWVRKSFQNYTWLSNLLFELCGEYTYRYGKVHKVESSGLLNKLLVNVPTNIPRNLPFTEPTPAMPDECKVPGDSIKSYRNYYFQEKQRMWSWKGKINSRKMPVWLSDKIMYDDAVKRMGNANI